ncbi:FG-GAP repeat protein [Posidoniimonas polymericola]|uniref:FG-GAP repeat protein n=1 Tax=Posidoniimonas polymericola TaxID=2528002 RepID=A0A5C5YTU2_9BACT|nr:FG-GAP-like repeat-containing protein [Posidoniimonas polymericola]TWT78378.1 FG-GAP repeat protein [Posidoniimonas polymericola]
MAWNRAFGNECRGKAQPPRRNRRGDRLARLSGGRSLVFELLEGRRLLAADFGDAPEPYPTLLADDGPRHEAVGPQLGATRTAEMNGLPSAAADADSGDDGVTFGEIRVGQANATVAVNVQNAPAGARLDAWIDFNGDGSWDGATDQIIRNAPVSDGENSFRFEVPSWAQAGHTSARFRISTIGGLSPFGPALDGEVEDYIVEVSSPSKSAGEYAAPTYIAHTSVPLTKLVTLDLDRDGDLDIVSLSFGGDAIVWLENGGELDFSEHLVPNTLDAPTSIAVADLDADGDLDLAAASNYNDKVAWYENDGSQSFTEHIVSYNANTASDVSFVDLDGDGDLDLLGTTRLEHTVSWYENDGLEHFTEHQIASDLYNAIGAEAVDLDGDGDLDILVERSGGFFYNIDWLQNDGSGNFTKRRVPTSFGNPNQPVVIDVDGDGMFDLTAVSGLTGAVGWYQNLGNGGFREHLILGTETGTVGGKQILAGDWDGDGDTDIATSSGAAPRVLVQYKNDGAEQFSASDPSYAAGGGAMTIGDIDQDGDLDLLQAFNSPYKLAWYENVVNASVTVLNGVASEVSPDSPLRFRLELSHPSVNPTVVGFSVGGSAAHGLDYVVGGPVALQGGLGQAEFPPGETVIELSFTPLDDSLFEGAESVVVQLLPGAGYAVGDDFEASGSILSDEFGGDFGDAPAPYPTLSASDGALHSESSANTPMLGASLSLEPDGLLSADASADDDNGVTIAEVRVGQSAATAVVEVSGAPGRLDAWIDFDRDGSWDGPGEQIAAGLPLEVGLTPVFFAVPATAAPGVTYARFRISSHGGLAVSGVAGDGEVEDYELLITPPVQANGSLQYGGELDPTVMYADSITTADLDRDGDVDIIASLGDGGLVWRENLSGGIFANHLIDSERVIGYALSTADLDLDGDLDLLVGSAVADSVLWYENVGQLAFVRRNAFPSLRDPRMVAASDVDRDGDIDVLGVSSGSDRTIAWYLNDGRQVFTEQIVSAGLYQPWDSVARDIDGDGDLDVLVASVNGDVLWFENAGDGNHIEQLAVGGLGYSTAVSAGDFDADGDTDIVAWSEDDERLVWLENDGGEVFTQHEINAFPSSPHAVHSIEVVDLDGDSDLDLAVNISSTGGFAWYENDGSGSFVEHAMSPANGAQLPVAADLDNDGDLELLTGRIGAEGVEWTELAHSVELAINQGLIGEADGRPLSITLTTQEAVNTSVEVAFSLSGAADYRSDYDLVGATSYDGDTGVITIPRGERMARLELVALNDFHIETSEALLLELRDGANYVLSGQTSATIVISSDDLYSDFGDAPSPFATLLSEDGARHSPTADPANAPLLGELLGSEPDGTPDAEANAHGSDDGVVFGELRPGQQDATITVTVSGAGGLLDAWIDFNADGSWGGVGEKIFNSVSVDVGQNELSFDVPSHVGAGPVYARFRLSSTGSPTPYGVAVDGEVEDYIVAIASPAATGGDFLRRLLISETDFNPESLEAADIDGDGDMDLLAELSEPSQVAWLENDGNENFEIREIAGATGRVLSSGDFDADGDVDFVTGGEQWVKWFENDGAGNFSSYLIAANWGLPSSAAIADMDGDGSLDIVVLSHEDRRLSWFRRTAPSYFEERAINGELGYADNLSLADIDRDGDIDVVTARSVRSSIAAVTWFENHGEGDFDPHVIDARGGIRATNPVDIDLDGDLDIAFSARGLRVAWYENDGSQNFTLITRASGHSYEYKDSEVGDFDGDGDLDFVVLDGVSYSVSYFYANDGDGQFTLASQTDPFVLHTPLLSVDLDGDGDLDQVALSAGSDMINWLENVVTAEISLQNAQSLSSEGDVLDLVVELDHARLVPTELALLVGGGAEYLDDYELLGATLREPGVLLLTIPAGQRSATYSLSVIDDLVVESDETLVATLAPGRGYRAGEAADFEFTITSDDTLADFGDAPAPYPTLLAQNGALHAPSPVGIQGPRLGASSSLETNGSPSAAANGDDDDGVSFVGLFPGSVKGIVAIAVQDAPGRVDAWIDFNGDGSWDSPGEHILSDAPVVVGDNTLIIKVPAWANPGVAYGRFRLSTAGGLGYAGPAADGEVEDYAITIEAPPATTSEFAKAGAITTLNGQYRSYQRLEAIDLDGDGDLDLLPRLPSSGEHWAENTGDESYVLRELGRRVDGVSPADIDQDGAPDLLVWVNGYSQGGFGLLENDGIGGFTYRTIDESFQDVMDAVAADINADGTPDLVVARKNGEVLWLEAAAGGYELHLIGDYATSSFDAGPVDLEVADVNADGYVDIVVTGDLHGLNPIWLQNDGHGKFKQNYLSLASNHNYATTVDIDDDGDLDVITIGRSVRWHVNDGGEFGYYETLSSSRYWQRPLIGDFDGDGRMEIAVGNDDEAVVLEYDGASGLSETHLDIKSSTLAVGDIDGNGTLDLLAWESSGEVTRWSQPLKISLSSGPSAVVEDSTLGIVIRVEVGSASHRGINVELALSGTATLGEDYLIEGASVSSPAVIATEIPAGSPFVEIVIRPIEDSVVELAESIIVDLLGQPGRAAGVILCDPDIADYGDAPFPYPVNAASGGAAHWATGPYLGATRTTEGAGFNSADAAGDAGDDGVVFAATYPGNASSEVTVELSDAPDGALLDAWIDFDGDGTWNGPGEHVFAGQPISEGENLLLFTTPGWALPGQSAARFRVSTTGGLGIVGAADDGEVEDYLLTIAPAQRKVPTFATGAIGAPESDATYPNVVDFDRDGDLDVVYVLNRQTIVWQENLGDTRFAEHTVGDLASLTILQPEVVDLNGDGLLDVLGVARVSGAPDTLGVFLQQADGFLAIEGPAGMDSVSTYAVGDIDSDGDIDLLFGGLTYGSNDGSPTLENFAWLENDGTAAFTRRVIPFGRPSPYPASNANLADLNGDGHLDFVVASAAGVRIVTFENNGSQEFTARLTDPRPTQSFSRYGTLTTGDFDLDGDTDLIATSGIYSSPGSWYENDGTGRFTELPSTFWAYNASSVTTADVDGDGDLDAVYSGAPFLTWQENRLRGDYNDDQVVNEADYEVWRSTYGEVGVAPRADGNADGRVDAVDYAIWRDARVAQPERVFLTQIAGAYGWFGAEIGDLDGDGDLDIVTGGYEGLTWFVNVPSVHVTTSGTDLLEGGEPLEVTFTRTEQLDQDFTLELLPSGTAGFNVDYTVNGLSARQVVIPAGSNSTTIALNAVDDGLSELDEPFSIGFRGGPKYAVTGTSRLSGAVQSDEPGGDFGDAPAPYATLLADDGARHSRLTDVDPRLGATRADSSDAAPSDTAVGDLDDDGVLLTTVQAGQEGASATVEVQGAAGLLDAWIDFNGNGSWDDDGEQVFASVPAGLGINELAFDVPADAQLGTTYARFRISTHGQLGPEGLAADGEVEDYPLMIDPAPVEAPLASSEAAWTEAAINALAFAAIDTGPPIVKPASRPTPTTSIGPVTDDLLELLAIEQARRPLATAYRADYDQAIGSDADEPAASDGSTATLTEQVLSSPSRG